MATRSQAQHRSKHARHQRWARLERAELWERYGALRTQGVSARQAAEILNVPRSTLQAWRAYQEPLDECPTVVAFLHSPPGLACLHRLVLALPVVCVEVGACGIRLVGLCLQSIGRNRFVGASYGAQQQLNCHVEEAIVRYRHQESARLAQARPARDITVTQDDTFTGGLTLGGREPVRTDIRLEQAADARDHDTWQACMEPALTGRNCRVIHSTSAEVPELLAYGAHHLGAHHSPALFHGQQAWSQAVSAPMAAKGRAAAKVVVQAEDALHHVPGQLHTTAGEPDRHGPGRPLQGAAHLDKGEQDVAAARHEHLRLAGQREKVAQSLRTIGHAYPFGD